jgi:hypothetical protein
MIRRSFFVWLRQCDCGEFAAPESVHIYTLLSQQAFFEDFPRTFSVSCALRILRLNLVNCKDHQWYSRWSVREPCGSGQKKWIF